MDDLKRELQSMCLDLKGIKVTQAQIAFAIGRKQPTVSAIVRGDISGKRIPHETVEELRKFHALKMKQARKAA